jgi:hypothetical protein
VLPEDSILACEGDANSIGVDTPEEYGEFLGMVGVGLSASTLFV